MQVSATQQEGAGRVDPMRQHAALIERVMSVAGALFDCSHIALVDAGSEAATPRAGQRTVLLSRGPNPALSRRGERTVALRYANPTSESALAMGLAAMAGPDDPIAADAESLSIFALADRLAASDIPVLINGPTGTGKEVLSRFIHARSARRSGPFIAVNCAAMPETMLEAMLFGHQKGAFTGATQASEGFMRAADGGTLLLDEIAELPIGLQAKLLRALQEQEVVPIGSTRPIKVDVRIIACANRDLPLEVAAGRFRADLYYRLNVFPLSLKPLRERTEDVAPLAFALALRHAPDPARVPCFNEAALAMLRLHSWPGNVRELENVVRRALLLAGPATTMTPEHIVFDQPVRLVDRDPTAVGLPAAPFAGGLDQPAPARAGAAPAPSDGKLASIVQRSEASAIIETLEACDGNRMRAARALGISERTLRYRLASFREAGIAISRCAAGAR